MHYAIIAPVFRFDQTYVPYTRVLWRNGRLVFTICARTANACLININFRRFWVAKRIDGNSVSWPRQSRAPRTRTLWEISTIASVGRCTNRVVIIQTFQNSCNGHTRVCGYRYFYRTYGNSAIKQRRFRACACEHLAASISCAGDVIGRTDGERFETRDFYAWKEDDCRWVSSVYTLSSRTLIVPASLSIVFDLRTQDVYTGNRSIEPLNPLVTINMILKHTSIRGNVFVVFYCCPEVLFVS